MAIRKPAMAAPRGWTSSSAPPAMRGSVSATSPGRCSNFPSSSTRHWSAIPRSSASLSVTRCTSRRASRRRASSSFARCRISTAPSGRFDAGADIIVAQGTEAGGHGKAGRTTLTLTPAVVDIAGSVPVVAAGGLSDGRGLAAALMLGASGILVGTRFWATPEALGSDKVKHLLTQARSDDTLRTRVFDIVRELPWPDGYTGRALVNDFSRKWHGNESELEKSLPRETEAYWTAARAGDTSTSVVFAGEGLDLIRDIKPAGNIVRAISAEAEDLLKTRPGVQIT
ncbi:NAD(P)H-dependent flavin oxidoreductase [Nordella sp. HKS 07]|uniref:NAD(P)H-dependent flavin oxidoreductase n=1 Tax=Nordella sp. HKS 07 TaxID=2712222 RepID=UPI00352E8BE3